MTQLRQHLYNLMVSDLPLKNAVNSVLLERGSFEVTPETRPFLIYAFGIQRGEPRWDRPRRLDLTVYVHDDVGDYLRIDSTMDKVDEALLSAPSSADGSGFISCDFLERSGDFQDDQLNTFYRFTRYQVVSSL